MLDALIRIYSSTSGWNEIFNRIKVTSLVRHILVLLTIVFERILFKPRNRLSETNGKERIIVSLTSFPARINHVWKTVVTLINQSCCPNKIIIWLSEDQFQDKALLPSSLRKLESYGVEIKFVKGDIRSHKKYYYAFKEFQDDNVILVDDDIIYPSTFIEELIKNFSSDAVHCSYGSKIKYNSNGEPLKYIEWESIFETYSGEDFFFGTGGGTLIRPSSLKKEVLNIKRAVDLCPTADDVWLNAMTRFSNLKIEKVRAGMIFPLSLGDSKALYMTNVGQNANDVQIKRIQKEYNSIFNCHKKW